MPCRRALRYDIFPYVMSKCARFFKLQACQKSIKVIFFAKIELFLEAVAGFADAFGLYMEHSGNLAGAEFHPHKISQAQLVLGDVGINTD